MFFTAGCILGRVIKSTRNFKCCVCLCCCRILAANCHFLLLLGQENSTLSVASVEKHTLVQWSPVMSGFVALLVSQQGLGLPRGCLCVKKAKWCSEVFWSSDIFPLSGELFIFPDSHKFSFSKGTPVSLETTNSLLDLLCFYGDSEPSPEKEQEEKEGLEEPEVWKTCWLLFIYFIRSESISRWLQDFCMSAWEMPWGGSDAESTFPGDTSVVKIHYWPSSSSSLYKAVNKFNNINIFNLFIASWILW